MQSSSIDMDEDLHLASTVTAPSKTHSQTLEIASTGESIDRLLIQTSETMYHWKDPGLALDLFTEFADHVAVPKILVGVRDRVEGKAPESLGSEAMEIAVWILALVEMAVATVLVFRWRQWWRAWCVALGAGLLLLFALYAHAPIWIGGAMGCGIVLLLVRLPRQAPLRTS